MGKRLYCAEAQPARLGFHPGAQLFGAGLPASKATLTFPGIRCKRDVAEEFLCLASEASINISAVSDIVNDDQFRRRINFVHDAVIPDSHPIQFFCAREFYG
jgi:hypothetical protein